jgi:hypothetical protein
MQRKRTGSFSNDRFQIVGFRRATSKGRSTREFAALKGDCGLRRDFTFVVALYCYAIKTLEEVEAEIRALPLHKQEELRDWLENLLEDRMELKEDFKGEIEAAKCGVH